MTSLTPHLNMVATCPDEIKDVLQQELQNFGCEEILPKYRAVHFKCTEEQFYVLHLALRTASNLMLGIKTCSASSPEMIFAQASRVKWYEFFDSRQTFKVDGIVADRGKHFLSSNDLSKKVKEAIWNSFDRQKLAKPTVELSEPEVTVIAYLQNGKMTLSLLTSGKALHKRGYRSVEGHPAPLKETLAAAILLLAGYDGSQVLFDPMCGSGTIAIEGTYIALNKAPMIHRKKNQFAFEHLKIFNPQLWRQVQDELRAEKSAQLTAAIFASDISANYITYARENALRARVEKYIDFSVNDFLKGEPPAQTGLLICNLPYGERLKSVGDADDFQSFYKNIGDVLKKKYQGWKIAFLVAEEAPWASIGLRPSKKINLLNGSIKTKLLIYEIFSGHWKEFKTQSSPRE